MKTSKIIDDGKKRATELEIQKQIIRKEPVIKNGKDFITPYFTKIYIFPWIYIYLVR